LYAGMTAAYHLRGLAAARGNIYHGQADNGPAHVGCQKHNRNHHKLIKRGSAVIVTGHNLETFKKADWIADMGQDSGSRAGKQCLKEP